MDFIRKIDEKFADSSLWQFVKFNLVSFSITAIQLLLANYPQAGCKGGQRDSCANEKGKKYLPKTAEICGPLRPYEAQVWKITQ